MSKRNPRPRTDREMRAMMIKIGMLLYRETADWQAEDIAQMTAHVFVGWVVSHSIGSSRVTRLEVRDQMVKSLIGAFDQTWDDMARREHLPLPKGDKAVFAMVREAGFDPDA